MMSEELTHLKNYGCSDKQLGEISSNDSKGGNGEANLNTDIDCEGVGWLESDIECIKKDRGEWANKLEFFLAIVGYTVGIASIWRFPVLCSRNGGGAFLIPFFFFLITSGGPLYYMEVCLGQFTGQSAGQAFEFCPLFRGLGMLQVTLSFTVVWYVMSTMTWILYFLYSSFFSELPWTSCTNTWNTERCAVWSDSKTSVDNVNKSLLLLNDTVYTNTTDYNVSMLFQHINSSTSVSGNVVTKSTTPAYEFWEYQVIGRSRGLEDMGSLQLHLVICLFLGWLFCVSAVIKGVKTLGKVVYVTATAPYLFLTIMFIKGLTLDGAIDGIRAFIEPDFSKLLTSQVWLEAAIQVFYSLGPSWGGVITMASYNRFHQKSFWSSTMCCIFSGFTSFYSGMVVFTILGFLSKSSGRTMTDIAQESGPGLVFVAFPTALGMMPLPHLWSVLFFVMLVLVVFDSLFGMFETVTSGVIDQFPHQLLNRRIHVNIITGSVFFITGLPLTMNGGIYIFQLADWYFSSFALLFGSLFECIAICWIYGTERFARDIHMMTGRDVSIILRLMWTIIIPTFVSIAFITLLTQYSTPAYGDGYEYTSSAVAVGIFIGMVPLIAMAVVGVITLFKQDGTLWRRFKSSLKPSAKWGPYDKDTRKNYKMKPCLYSSSRWRNFVINVTGTSDKTEL